jgi:hypothetical protein
VALDFGERHRSREWEVLKKSRAGRWFVENDMDEELGFVGDVGASEFVPEVVDGRLRIAEEGKSGSPLGVHDTGG